MPEKNMKLLWDVYDYIAKHPAEWNQKDWASKVRRKDHCGTAFCFAGHAVTMSHPESRPCQWLGGTSTPIMEVDGKPVMMAQQAQEDLGLSSNEGSALFYGGNSLEQIHDILMDWEEREWAKKTAV